MIKQGLVWTILLHWFEEVWPGLPDLAQDALNAAHATFSMATELQVMMSIAKRAEGKPEGKIDWAQIKADVKASQPPRVEYLDEITTFVQLYAGGPGAPIACYLVGFFPNNMVDRNWAKLL